MLDAGAGSEELLSGYPSLTPHMLELARIWVTARPRRGRPKLLSEFGVTPKSTKRVPRRGDPLAGRLSASIKG
jgi:hypothetical protein